jgi:hypothetical protein
MQANSGTPKSLLLVHGAGSGPWAFDGWEERFPELAVVAPDLQDGLELSRASMQDYVQRVIAAARQLQPPMILCGWSMGGLVAMIAAPRINPEVLFLIEASAPAEVQGVDETVAPQQGVYGAEQVYGPFPLGIRSRTESRYALHERKRGISVPALPSRTLVIAGKEFPDERGRKIASFYNVPLLEFPALGHWQLIHSAAVTNEIRQFAGLPVA